MNQRKSDRETPGARLSRRERQIMDAVYRLGSATAAEIVDSLPDPPTKDAIRRLIRILEEKGWLRHEADGIRHVYHPTVPADQARRTALDHVIQTHFRGSVSQAIAALLQSPGHDLTDRELREIRVLIQDAQKEGR